MMEPSTQGNEHPHAILGPSKQIACYSVNSGGVEFNTSSLRYFTMPPLGVDLDKGWSSFERYHSNDLHRPHRLDSVLAACLDDPSAKRHLLQADIVIRRGALVNIILGTKIDLNVSFIDGLLYIEEHDSHPRRAYFRNNYSGLTFESICTTDSPEAESMNDYSHVEPDEKWLSIIKRQLGDLSIVMAGEVDCIKGQYTGQPNTFLELKLKKRITGSQAGRPSNAMTQWYKKAYLQSHLLGVNELFIGYHNDSVLSRTEFLPVVEILSRVGRMGQPWNPQTMIDRGHATLTTIRDLCRQDADNSPRGFDGSIWRVEARNSHPKITCRKLGAREVITLGNQHIEESRERIGIVPLDVVRRLREESKLN